VSVEVTSLVRERLAAEGWEERFSAAGVKLAEAIRYYESLGYEVHVEDLLDAADEGACTTCFTGEGAGARVGIIFTRSGGVARGEGDDLFE